GRVGEHQGQDGEEYGEQRQAASDQGLVGQLRDLVVRDGLVTELQNGAEQLHDLAGEQRQSEKEYRGEGEGLRTEYPTRAGPVRDGAGTDRGLVGFLFRAALGLVVGAGP